MPMPSTPPRRLITTSTLLPTALPNDACRNASPNTDVVTAAPVVAAMPARKRRRDSPAALSNSSQQPARSPVTAAADGLVSVSSVMGAGHLDMCWGESSSTAATRTNWPRASSCLRSIFSSGL